MNKWKIIGFLAVLVALIATYSWYQQPADETVNQGDVITRLTTFEVYSDDLPDDVLDKYYQEFTERKDFLLSHLEDPMVAWQALLKMGVLKQMVGDYNGAEEVWLYMYDMDSTSYVLTGNLAHLYQYFLGNYQEAERFYLEALAAENINPINHYNYFSELYDLYRYRLPDQNKAEDLLNQALEALPEDVNVYLMTARHYKDFNDFEQARYYYNEALKINPDSVAAQQGLEKLNQ